jgi:hypothetical protein
MSQRGNVSSGQKTTCPICNCWNVPQTRPSSLVIVTIPFKIPTMFFICIRKNSHQRSEENVPLNWIHEKVIQITSCSFSLVFLFGHNLKITVMDFSDYAKSKLWNRVWFGKYDMQKILKCVNQIIWITKYNYKRTIWTACACAFPCWIHSLWLILILEDDKIYSKNCAAWTTQTLCVRRNVEQLLVEIFIFFLWNWNGTEPKMTWENDANAENMEKFINIRIL